MENEKIGRSIEIIHGIYDIYEGESYRFQGFWNRESSQLLPLPNRFKQLLAVKGLKFQTKYGMTHILFVYAHDGYNHIASIAICHSIFDVFDSQIGEDIAVGRIKRMRGDVKKIIYDMEKYEKDVLIYHNKKTGKSVYKTMEYKRVVLSAVGSPIVKERIFFKPYDYFARYRTYDKENKCTIAGELKYPYIYMMGMEND